MVYVCTYVYMYKYTCIYIYIYMYVCYPPLKDPPFSCVGEPEQ